MLTDKEMQEEIDNAPHIEIVLYTYGERDSEELSVRDANADDNNTPIEKYK